MFYRFLKPFMTASVILVVLFMADRWLQPVPIAAGLLFLWASKGGWSF
jgi:hypothetical protein